MQPEDMDQARRDALHLRRYYESQKSLGQLFRAIPRSLAKKDRYTPPTLPLATDGTDPDDAEFAVDEPVTAALRNAMLSHGVPCPSPSDEDLAFAGRLMARYALELRHIAFANTLVSQPGQGLAEADIVMGLISGPAVGSGQRRKDAVEKATLQASELVRAIKKQLTAPRRLEPVVAEAAAMASGEDDVPPMEKPEAPLVPPPTTNAGEDGVQYEDDRGRRAWAAWCVATRAPPEKFGCRSFGLVALGAVMDVIEQARQAKRDAAAKDLQDAVRDAGQGWARSR
jgi:hypothetical protein